MSLRSLERQGPGHHGTLSPEILLAPGAPNATRWVSISNAESEGKTNSKNKNAYFPCVIPGFHAGHRFPSLVTAPFAGFGVTTSRQPLVDSPKWLLLVVCTEGGWLVIQNHAGLSIFLWIYLILWPFLVLQTNPCSSRIIFYECILYRLYSMHENMPWVLSDI